MTGPLLSKLHLHRRRARHLLPFAAAILLGSLACSDQPTESRTVQSNPSVGVTRPHPYFKLRSSPSSMGAATSPKISASVASAGVGNAGPRVLLLADVADTVTDALFNRLDAEGFQVYYRRQSENTWNGFNPALTDFDAVIHLNGATYDMPLSKTAQRTLSAFVQNGGGFIAGQWNGSEKELGQQIDMPELVLQGYYSDISENGADTNITYNAVAEQVNHPVLAGIPASFTFHADGHDAGPAYPFSNPSTVLMRVPSGGPAVLVRQVGAGRVVNFSFAPNYPIYDNETGNLKTSTLLDPNVQQLYVNAVKWTRESVGLLDQTITFDNLIARTFGELPFAVGGSASSGLPVDFTAAGKCTIEGVIVTLTGAGTCTITAHQAGNSSYNPAPDVERSFPIAKAPATLALSDLSRTYNGSPLAATATTTPAGLDGVAITYNGSLTPPTNAGSYTVTASLTNDDYQAAPATATLVIGKATASLTVGTSFVYDGSPKSAMVSTTPAQLQEVTLTYTQNGLDVPSPTNVGSYQVVAHLVNPNYQAPDAFGTLTITRATPVIQWSPAPLLVGTQLGDAQLNATATGVRGDALTGDFVYTPAAGTRFNPGMHTLSVEFSTRDGNYFSATQTVELPVLHKFSGFYQPVKNLPVMNVVRAGRTVPLKFSMEWGAGLRILQVGAPSSVAVACGAAPQSTMPDQAETSSPRLHLEGLTYTYHWSTNASWAGSCRKLVLTLDDGSRHEALFRFVQSSSDGPAKGGKKEEKKEDKKTKKDSKR